MAVVKNLMVRAGADFSAITKQAQKASTSMRGMQSSVSRSCDIMSKAASGLKRAFSAIGIGVSAAALISFGKAAAEAYDEQVAGEVRLAQVMRNTMGASNSEIQSILDLADAQQALGVVEGDAIVAGAQELATYLGLTDSLETLIPVMTDMAAQQYGFNATAEETTSIATMLGKVMEGQVSGLSRYGYYFDEAQEQILKYGTEAQRAATLADVVTQSVGGMNAALGATPTGRMVQLKNTLGDIKESFGQAVRTIGTVFLPLLNAVANTLAAIANIANKVAQSIANVFGGTVAGKEWQYLSQGAAVGIGDAADEMESLGDSTKKAGKAAKEAHKELQTLSFDTMNILRDTSSSSSEDIGDTIAEAVAGSSAGGSGLSEATTAPNEVAEGLGWLEERLQSLKEKWEDFKSRIDLNRLGESWDNLKEKLSIFGDTVSEKLGPLWDNYLVKFGEWTINEYAPQLLDTLAAGFQTLNDVLVELGPALDLAINLLGEGLSLAGSDAISMLEDLEFTFELISTLINDGPVAAWKLLKEHTVESSREAREAWGDFPEWVDQHMITPVVDFVNEWLDAHPKIAEQMQGIWNDIESLFGAFPQWVDNKLVQPMRKWLQEWIEAHHLIKKIMDLLGIGVGGDTGSNHPDTSSFKKYSSWFSGSDSSGDSQPTPSKHSTTTWHAKGGIFDRPSIIGVGEAGNEAVVPLERNTGWISKLAGELSSQMTSFGNTAGGDLAGAIRQAVFEGMVSAIGNSGGSTREMSIIVNGREFIRAVFDDIQTVSREHGISLIVA